MKKIVSQHGLAGFDQVRLRLDVCTFEANDRPAGVGRQAGISTRFVAIRFLKSTAFRPKIRFASSIQIPFRDAAQPSRRKRAI